jgi:hypothetical protein
MPMVRSLYLFVLTGMLVMFMMAGIASAATPVISGVTFSPTSGVLRIGQTLTATITADTTGYSAGAITINSKAVTAFTEVGGGVYTVTYTVAAGDTDILQTAQIPVSVVLSDPASNRNLPFTTSPLATAAPAIDGKLADTVAVVTTTGLTLSGPTGLTSDASGNLYFADTKNNRVVIMDAAGATNVIGDGTAAFGGDGSVAGSGTQLKAPSAVALDAAGNLYIADTGNNRIRKVTAIGGVITAASKISTVAGSSTAGFAGDGAAATSAFLNGPTGVAVDPSGNIYIADNQNYRIRKVTVTTTTAVISTIAGDGAPTTISAYSLILSPTTLDLYFTEPGNNRVRKIIATNKVVSATSLLVTIAGTGVAGHSGDGDLATLATLNQPGGVTTDGNDLFISDSMNNCIRKVSLATGVISTRVGSTAQDAAITATLPSPILSIPLGIAINAAGDVYVADSGNNLIKQVYASNSVITSMTPHGGTYSTAQTVTLTTNKAATTYYTLDGTTPPYPGGTPAATLYAGTITIPATPTKLKFASVDAVTGAYETVTTATYTFDTVAPVTVATPNTTAVSGIYYSARSSLVVTLAAVGAKTIYYSTDGKTPTTIYTVPISIPVTSTQTTTNLQYYAVDDYGNTESLRSTKYTVVALTTTASVSGGIFTTAQSVTLTANDSTARIYYLLSTTGQEPTAIPLDLYNSAAVPPIAPIATSEILKYFAVDADNYNGAVKTESYTIDGVTPITTASVLAGTYTSTQSVILSASKTASIYYTTDGAVPTITSTKYGTTPISISKTTTLKYFAKDTAGNQEVVQTQVYTVDSVAPVTTASVLTGVYASIQSVSLAADDSAATIYFTLDGSTPTITSQKYSIPLVISRTTTLKYFARDVLGNLEAEKSQTYTIVTLTTTASPSGGSFASTQSVALTSNSPGAAIYYTTDGTIPTVVGTTLGKTTKKYTTPVLVTDTTNAASTTTVLQFFAVDKAGVTEKLRSATYRVDIVVPSTAAVCDTGTPNTITLTATDSSDPIPVIKYRANTITTQNGVTVAAYTLSDYAFPIVITSNTIVKFFAVDAAGNAEQIKTAYCPISASTAPAIYLETMADTTTTDATTLYVRGNVAPFATTTLAINTALVSTNSLDGSFSNSLAMPLTGNTLSAIATNGADVTTVTRTITGGAATTVIGIGTNNGVVGNLVRVPITLTSGYQATAINVDVGYAPLKLTLPRAELSPAAKALNKTIKLGTNPSGNFRLVITDQLSASFTPLPDGVVAYLIFSVLSGTGGTDTLANTSVAVDRANDIGGATMTVTVSGGVVNIKSSPGDSDGTPGVTLKEVLDALWMMIDPVAHPVDGAVDLDADGTVSISEFQRVINTFVGL